MSSVRFLASAGMALAVCMESGNPFLRHEVLDFVLSELGIPVPPREDRLALEFSPEELVGEYVGLRGFKVSVEYDHPSIRILVAGEGGGVAAYSCRVNDDATVSIDPGQKVIALAFFPDPSTRAPCVTIGLHSLRQDRPPRA